MELGEVKPSENEHKECTFGHSVQQVGLVSCCYKENGQAERQSMLQGRGRKIFLSFKLVLRDSNSKEVRISSYLGTYMKESCSYPLAFRESLFYVGFPSGLLCVCCSLLINRAGFFSFLNSRWFLLFQVRRMSFKLYFSWINLCIVYTVQLHIQWH